MDIERRRAESQPISHRPAVRRALGSGTRRGILPGRSPGESVLRERLMAARQGFGIVSFEHSRRYLCMSIVKTHVLNLQDCHSVEV